MGQPATPPDISLAELERLIRILGMLGSASDGEVLNAGRLAQRWVADKQTSWEALLVPEPLPAVVGVAAPRDPDQLAEAHQADRVAAFKNGYQAGLRDMAAQLKAQNAYVASGGVAGQGSPVHGAQGLGGAQGGGQAQTPSGAPGGPVWPAGSWQAIAQALLDRHAQGVPGVLRSREEVFVSDILQRGFPNLTQAQEDWLRAIAARSAMSW